MKFFKLRNFIYTCIIFDSICTLMLYYFLKICFLGGTLSHYNNTCTYKIYTMANLQIKRIMCWSRHFPPFQTKTDLKEILFWWFYNLIKDLQFLAINSPKIPGLLNAHMTYGLNNYSKCTILALFVYSRDFAWLFKYKILYDMFFFMMFSLLLVLEIMDCLIPKLLSYPCLIRLIHQYSNFLSSYLFS